MSRLTDAILPPKQGLASYTNSAILDLKNGGTHGYAPNLTEWVSNQARVSKNLYCLLLEAPGFFQFMPQPAAWVQTLKSMMELHTQTIEGLNGGLTVAVDQHPVGGGGELQDEPTNVTRERTEPKIGFGADKYGAPIQNFLTQWIMNGIMDPDTKTPSIITLNNTKPADQLADWFSMTCLFYEPDPTGINVFRAWLISNMYPLTTGDIVGKKDRTAPGEFTVLDIPFAGIAQFNLGVTLFAQSLLDSINFTNANPYLRPAFVSGISGDVSSAQIGLMSNIRDLGSSAVSQPA